MKKKIYEKINEIEGKTYTLEEMSNYMYQYKQCPIDILEYFYGQEEYEEVKKIVESYCNRMDCRYACVEDFLKAEI